LARLSVAFTGRVLCPRFKVKDTPWIGVPLASRKRNRIGYSAGNTMVAEVSCKGMVVFAVKDW